MRGIHSCRPWFVVGLVCPGGHRFTEGDRSDEEDDQDPEDTKFVRVPIPGRRPTRPSVQQVAEALVAEVKRGLIVAEGAGVPQAVGVLDPVEEYLKARTAQWLGGEGRSGSLVLAALLTAGSSLLVIAAMRQLLRPAGLLDKHLSEALKPFVRTGPKSSAFRSSGRPRGGGGGFFENWTVRMQALVAQKRKLEWGDAMDGGPVGGVWPITEFQP